MNGLSETSAPGARVGPWWIGESLGEGGMATVHLAHRVHQSGGPGSMAALKRLRLCLITQPDLIERFRFEAQLMQRLDHPNIVRVVDHGVIDGQPYMAMSLVDGIDLGELISWLRERGRRLPLGEVYRLARELLDGLGYAHELCHPTTGVSLDIVHRDIKPSNLLIGRSGQMQIADFGIAVANDRSWSTATGLIPGTVAYMPPELLGDSPPRPSPRIDLWAVGVVLYELVSLRPLFRQSSVASTMQSVLKRDVQAAVSRLSGVPQGFKVLLGRLLERDPARRPEAVRELRGLLDASPPERPSEWFDWLEAIDSIQRRRRALRSRKLQLQTDDLGVTLPLEYQEPRSSTQSTTLISNLEGRREIPNLARPGGGAGNPLEDERAQASWVDVAHSAPTIPLAQPLVAGAGKVASPDQSKGMSVWLLGALAIVGAGMWWGDSHRLGRAELAQNAVVSKAANLETRAAQPRAHELQPLIFESPTPNPPIEPLAPTPLPRVIVSRSVKHQEEADTNRPPMALPESDAVAASGSDSSPPPPTPTPASIALLATPLPSHPGDGDGAAPALGAGGSDPMPAAPEETAGSLSLNTVPWSLVSLSGREPGMTPMQVIDVPAGHHVIEIAPQGDVDRMFTVIVEVPRGGTRKAIYDIGAKEWMMYLVETP